jgi:hypothetical protein
MLKAAGFRSTGWRSACVRALSALGCVLLAGRVAVAGVSPILAQDSSGEGGYAIIEWAIVVVLTGAALFVICRSSRRN